MSPAASAVVEPGTPVATVPRTPAVRAVAARGVSWLDTTVVIGGVALAVLGIWQVLSGSAAAIATRVCAGAMFPLALVFQIVVWIATADRAIDPQTRRAWQRLAFATSTWWAAGVAWELMGRPPFSVLDVYNILYFPLVLWGVFGFPSVRTDRAGWLRFCLDSGVVVVSGAAGVWYLILWPTFTRPMTDVTAIVVNAAYPLGDLVLLFAACAALVRGSDRRSRLPLAWVAAGLIGRFVGELLFGWETLAGTYHSGGVTDLTWVTAVWALAAGATAQRRAARVADAPAAPGTARDGVDLLPYASVVAVYVFLLATASAAWGGRPGGVLVCAVAVTGLVLARQFLATRENVRLQRERTEREGEARFRLLVQHASDVVAVIDREARVLYASPSCTRVLGYAAEGILDGSLVSLVHPDDQARVRAAIDYAAGTSGTTGPLTLRMRCQDGEWRTMEALTANLVDEPAVGGIVITARDVTERAALEAQLAHQAFHDPLTGLANRALFRDRVEQALARAARRGDTSVAVLFLDLDDFKTVNDSLGHLAGDRLLHAVAQRLLAATRGSDTVARLGGDEFAVLLEDGWAGAAVAVAERIGEVLSAPLSLDGTIVGVATSVGIAHARAEDGADELLRNADVAMYRAKSHGKGGHEVFAPEMHAALLDRLALEADLRRAVGDATVVDGTLGGDPASGEFLVLYQPIVELEGGQATGAEALVRWRHPQRGLVSPAAFIPLAEATGLIVPLGEWVLRQACVQGAQWQALRDAASDVASDRLAPLPPLTITVNLSGRQLQHPGLLHAVSTALDESGLRPSSLVLEITESVIMQDTESNLATLHALKELGVRLAIDDFGTGYSSLSYLQKFPVDILKIDKTFVDGVARGGSEAALARTIVALGDTLSLRCVAEGIEDDEQRRHLRALGCAFGQGYFFARPLPPERVTEMLTPATSAAA
jgi:diguanylate cyclase (GGDEF)-like protein/PAS domain S-box-containing protein